MTGEHEYRHCRGVEGDQARDVPACRRPRRMQCRRCPRFVVLPCENSATSVCEPCGTRYRRRVQTVALLGTGVDVDQAAAAVGADGDEDDLLALAALAQRQGPATTLVLTVTAPGNGRHRDRTKAGAPWCPCTPIGGVDLAEWNGRAGERWNRLCQDLRRSGLLGEQVQYFRAAEVQDGKRRADGRGRNALHEHVLLQLRGVVQVTPALVEALRALAIRHGYGHEVVIERAAVSLDGRARLAAWYAAKYVSKASDLRAAVPWRRRLLGVKHSRVDVVDTATGEVRNVARVDEQWSPASYRNWTASRGWGCSMRAVKESQRAYARLLAGEGQDLVTTAGASPPTAPPAPPAGVAGGGAPP